MILKKTSLLCIALVVTLIMPLTAWGEKNSQEQSQRINQPEMASPVTQGEDVSHVNGDLTLTIPTETADLVLVDTPQNDPNGVLFSVSEKDSVDAALADGHEMTSGEGWLFGIRRVDETTLHGMLCYDMSGEEVFARDADGYYYLYTHPTDVRLYRRNNAYEEAMEQWSKLYEWAWNDVRHDFLAKNPCLTAFTRGNSMLDMYLARVAYQKDVTYTVSTTEHGLLFPNCMDASPYVERLMDFTSSEDVDIGETPDGEYVVLSFPEDDVRFDFFCMAGRENYVRMVWSGGNEQLIRLSFSDDTRASAVMQDWYDALASAGDLGNATLGYKPDDLVGRWAEKIAGRGCIIITKTCEGDYRILIDWPNSAYERSIWEMSATPAGVGGALKYEDAKHYVRTFSSDTEYTDELKYENGSGLLYLNSANEVMWEDKADNAGENCVFISAEPQNGINAWHYVLTTEKRTEKKRNDEGFLLAETSYELPKLDVICDRGDAPQTPPEEQRKVCEVFNSRVAELSQSLNTVEKLAENAQEQYNEMSEEYRRSFGNYSEELSVSESRQSGDLLEVSFQTYGYWGGAHGGSSFFSWHYDLADGKFIELADLCDEPEKLNQMVANEIISSIEKGNETDGYFEDYAETIRAKERFEVSFGADAMTVTFSQYEIACYASGIPTFEISYDKLVPFLNEYGRRLLRYSVI